MFQTGELIMYGNMGVCRVEAIGTPQGVPSAQKEYYSLAPLHTSGIIYIPVDAPVFMRRILTKEQALALIARIPEIREEPCEQADQRQLAAHYRATIQMHDCEELIQLIKTVYQKERSLNANGKKLGKTDQQFMKQAETLLHGELAAALEIPLESVPDYIARAIEKP